MQIVRWINGILGLWVALAAFLGFGPVGNLWNDMAAGVVIVAFGLIFTQGSRVRGWTVAVLGGWLLVSALAEGLLEPPGLLWNNLIVGLGTAYAAFLPSATGRAITEIRTHDHPHQAAHH